MSQFATDAGPVLPLAKPLDWRKPTDHPQDREGAILMAPGLGGRYSIEETRAGNFLLWMADDEFVWREFGTLERAKEAAERDWQVAYRRKARPPAPDAQAEGE